MSALVARGLVRMATLDEVLHALRAHDCRVLVLKGGVSSCSDMLLRDCEDIDLLVAREDLDTALGVLGSLGYLPTMEVRTSSRGSFLRHSGETPFHCPGRAPIDLHWEFLPRWGSYRPDMDGVWDRARVVRVEGREIPTLSPEDALLHLSVHGGWSLWRRRLWVEDVADLLRAHPGLDGPAVEALARGTGTLRLLAVGLLLARTLEGAVPPRGLSPEVLGDGEAIALADGYASVLEHRAEGPTGPIQEVAQLLHQRERVIDRVRMISGLLGTPRRAEWARPLRPAPVRWMRRGLRALRHLAARGAMPAETAA